MEAGRVRAGIGGGKDSKKGTATPLATMFPVEEARKAKSRVEDAISEKQKEMDQIKDFIADNKALINLVSMLPDELHHDIMVPFGRGAFFPGRLVHTNEFMVLLGEGYYVERSARQTLEILKRRGEALDSQVESLLANIKDLRAEASFFDVTASEAAEGVVEIREDFVEENATETDSSSKPYDQREAGDIVEDDDYARMMARLDELEKEELEAEGSDGSDVDNQMKVDESDNSSTGDEKMDAADSNNESNEDEQIEAAENSNESDEDEQINAAEGNRHSGEYSQEKAKSHQLPLHTYTQTEKLGYDNSKAFPVHVAQSSQNNEPTSHEEAGASSKALIGSIVERTHNLQISSANSSQPSRPISRFKMQRR